MRSVRRWVAVVPFLDLLVVCIERPCQGPRGLAADPEGNLQGCHSCGERDYEEPHPRRTLAAIAATVQPAVAARTFHEPAVATPSYLGAGTASLLAAAAQPAAAGIGVAIVAAAAVAVAIVAAAAIAVAIVAAAGRTWRR